jgi:hypothetical protein
VHVIGVFPKKWSRRVAVPTCRHAVERLEPESGAGKLDGSQCGMVNAHHETLLACLFPLVDLVQGPDGAGRHASVGEQLEPVSA